MKILILLAVATAAYAEVIKQDVEPIGAYGFIKQHAIPLADEIRDYEELWGDRIVGGSTSVLGQFPYQAGFLVNFIGTTKIGVCGGSLVSPNRVITAAHCWYDGESQGYQSTVVLGSVLLFSGGTRLNSRTVIMHPQWDPRRIRNDVAVIYLPRSVSYTDTISPISLPTGDELQETYVGEVGVASGFGLTSDNDTIGPNQVLNHVALTVITNAACILDHPIVTSNICTSNGNITATCRGDSGGPLAINKNNRTLLIGITSYGPRSCERGISVVFSRVSSFIAFFNEHLS